MTVKEIVKKYLEENGFDGLYASGECVCKNDDLMPCCGDMENCEPGYFQPCGRSDNRLDGWDFHIGLKKIEQANQPDQQPDTVSGKAVK